MANLNYYPASTDYNVGGNIGSDEWLNNQLDYYRQQITQQVKENAAARGLDPNSPMVQAEIERQLEAIRQQLTSEAAKYKYESEENEKNRQAQEKMTKESAKSQERASLWSGLGQLGGNLLFTPNLGSSQNNSLFSKGLSEIKSLYTPKTTPGSLPGSLSDTGMSNLQSSMTKSLPFSSTNKLDLGYTPPETTNFVSSTPDFSSWQKLGETMLGSGLGALINPGKGSTQNLLTSGGSSLLANTRGYNYNPLYSGIGSLLGGLVAPNEGLFSNKSNFWRSLLSLGLSGYPLISQIF
jgi:hypothetical protein